MNQQDKTYGMLCHLLALSWLIGIPFGNIVGPLVIWLVKKDESPFVDEQGKSSLNFQISFTIYALVASVAATIISIVTCGIGAILFPAIGILAIVQIILVIMASIEASNGRSYSYPFTMRFIV